jgi:4-hydroxy-tetrahydrodipicolinate synthase
LNNNKLGGVIAAIPTPVNEAGDPMVDVFLTHAKWALSNGCDGLNVLGTTGEANSLSTEKRMQVMSAAAQHLDQSVLMVGTGTPDYETTEKLTLYAAELGYAGALILPPYYYKPIRDDALYSWFARLVAAVSETDIKLYLYNFPAMTGIRFSVALLMRLATDFPDKIVGIKDSSGDLTYCRDIVNRVSGFSVFPSSETTLPTAHAEGYAGCISATVNLTAPVSQLAWQNREAAVTATFEQRLKDLREGISGTPLIPSIKYLLSRRHEDTAWCALRPPLQPLADQDRHDLDAVFEQLKTQTQLSL